MRTFLCGKGAGAAAILRRIVKADFYMVAVFSPDEALTDLAHELGVWCTAESVNQMHLWPWKPEVIVSVGYLDIITPAVIEAMDGMVINCHYALLPNHRGRSSVPWAILYGDTCTGVTWHYIDESIDTGRILMQATCQIASDETQASLFGKLDALAALSWPAAEELVFAGYEGMPQHGPVRYHKAGPPHGGEIDPTWSGDYVERFIRAMVHPPRPYATYNGIQVKTWAEYSVLRDAVHTESLKRSVLNAAATTFGYGEDRLHVL